MFDLDIAFSSGFFFLLALKKKFILHSVNLF